MTPRPTVESLVRMYREAIQANDYRLAVQTLRNLGKTDASQNWNANLAQAEKALQVQLENAFEVAVGNNDVQTAVRLAREYMAQPWLITPIGNAATAMRAYLEGFDAAQGGKPLRLMQQPEATLSHPPVSDDANLPPRTGGKKFSRIVAACVVAILALAAGLFVIWQDGEREKRAEQAERIRLAKEEAACQKEMRETAISNFVLVVNLAVSNLEKINLKITTTENPGQFSEYLRNEKERVRDARRFAILQGITDGILKPFDDKFENAISVVEKELWKKRLMVEANRNAEQAKDEFEDEVPSNSPFIKAENVKRIAINDLNSTDFLAHQGQSFQVFFYADTGQKELQSTSVTCITTKIGNRWSPKPDEVLKRSKGLFTIWLNDKDNTAYWLWNLPRNADNGERWFWRAADDSTDMAVEFDLKREVFGNTAVIYKFYTKHFGDPTYMVTRSDNHGEMGDILGTHIEVADSTITDQMFKPSAEERSRSLDALEQKVVAMERKLEELLFEHERGNDIAQGIERGVAELKRVLFDYARARKRGGIQVKNLDKRRHELIGEIERMSMKLGGRIISATDLLRCTWPEDVDRLLKEKKLFDANGKVTREDVNEATKIAKAELEKAKKGLADFDAFFDKKCRTIAEQSRYAVTAVVGSKESGKTRK